MPKVTPFLWLDTNAEEAIRHWGAIFTSMRVLEEHRMGKEGPLFSATIEIEGQRLMLLNGGPHFKFNEAISLFVSCQTQAEVDDLWSKLSAGGSEGRCGWLKDKFGLSWQIVPKALGELMGKGGPAKAKAVMEAMRQMGRLDVAALQAAYHRAD